MHVYRDEPRTVQVTLDQLNDVYPGSDILLIEDGLRFPPFKGCQQLKEPERLKIAKYGGAWTHRYLERYLSLSQAPYLIKLDPDTKVNKAATDLPQGLAIFCSVGKLKTRTGEIDLLPHGGALGFTRMAAEWIVSHRIFLAQELRGSPRYFDQQDAMFRDLAKKHLLTFTDRDDFVCGFWKDKSSDYAFYHP